MCSIVIANYKNHDSSSKVRMSNKSVVYKRMCFDKSINKTHQMKHDFTFYSSENSGIILFSLTSLKKNPTGTK